MLVTTVVVIVVAFTATLLSDNRPVLGLDLQGGISIVLFPVKGSDLSTLDAAVSVIRNRVDGLGIAEPEVNRQGNTIVIDLPGVKDRQKAEDLVGQTAELRYRLVQGFQNWNGTPTTTPTTTSKAKGTTTTAKAGATTTTKAPTTTTKPATTTTGHAAGRTITTQPIASVHQQATTATTAPATTATTAAGATTTTKPGATTTTTAPAQQSCAKIITPRDKNTATATVVLPDRDHTGCYLLGPSLLTGKGISHADPRFDTTSSSWVVDITFKNDDFVTKVATPYVNQDVAIELDGVVQSAPKINPGITGRNVQISGNFSEGEARDLALVLRYGSLPIQFDKDQQTVQSVSPSLGKDQLRAGIFAGLIGLALVALYMILFYRLLGLVVWIGLGLTGMTFFALVSWLSVHRGLTLTLAGVTGIIVSVGVTVDSYVVYFERLKDEVRTGKTVRTSLDPGFRRAFRTIIAADLVSLIGAIILYLLATSSVRGFAFFLGLSTALDLLLAYTFMHPMVLVLARRPSLVRMPGVGIAAGLDVPEVKA